MSAPPLRRCDGQSFRWLALLALFALAAPTAFAAEPARLAGRALGTTWTVKFVETAPLQDHATLRALIAQKLEHLEQHFSTYRATSELSRFNAAQSTDWIDVSPELARVAADSRSLSERSGGAFDATVAPLLTLWGFGPSGRGTSSIPTPAEISAARARVDYRELSVRLAPPALRKSRPDLAVDFSSMAKGFAVDTVSELLGSLGLTEHFVQIGGDIATAGTRIWRVGIEQPTAPGAIAQTLELTDQALSTSGDAHNRFERDGRLYSHLLDPRTGEPAQGPLASVSVVHESCAASSSLATALFVLGAEAGYAFAVREEIAALFIVRSDGALTLRPTPAFTQRFPSVPRTATDVVGGVGIGAAN